MKGKLIKDLHTVNIYRHPITRKKLETLKTSDIINIWNEYYKKVVEETLVTEEA